MTTQQIETGMAAYQILDAEGNLVGKVPALSSDRMMQLYCGMHRGRALSNKIVALQRQGRATTFGPLLGQEASSIGIAAPMQEQDWLTTSYREIASLMWRGAPLSALIYNYRGYVSPSSPELRTLPVQIVIASQMLHAVGLGMAAKIAHDPVVSVGVCGDGATSEGDFNEALNFAGVFQAPTVLVVQNNGWAISVPRRYQCAAPTLAARGPGFGVPSVLVDGNDILAVYETMEQALARARSGQGPTLVELLTYRMGAHTTSDDPTRYRDEAELEAWRAKDPIKRFRRFLLDRGILTEQQDNDLVAEVEAEVNAAANEALAMSPPSPDSFFETVGAELSPRLQQQRQDLLHYAAQGRDGRG